jgi:hypothetical protein
MHGPLLSAIFDVAGLACRFPVPGHDVAGHVDDDDFAAQHMDAAGLGRKVHVAQRFSPGNSFSIPRNFKSGTWFIATLRLIVRKFCDKNLALSTKFAQNFWSFFPIPPSKA